MEAVVNWSPPIPPPTGSTIPAVPAGLDYYKEILLGAPLTEGYKPSIPLWAMGGTTTAVIPQFHLMREIEAMMVHPEVLNALNFYKSGISGAEFEVEVDPGTDTSIAPAPIDPATGQPQLDPATGQPVQGQSMVGEFIMNQCQRFWDRGVPKLQGGYEYGWIGCEAIFTEEGEKMEFEDLVQFSPRDVRLLTRDHRPVGVRVMQVEEKDGAQQVRAGAEGAVGGQRDLWLATESIPAKGLWYAHNPRYHQYYGQSQLLGAWRPWRCLAGKDGGEEVLNAAIYRYGMAGVQIGYPEEDLQQQAGSPSTTLNSQGNTMKYCRDFARMLAEQAKSGAGIGLPTSKYPQDMGGGDKWTIKWPEAVLNVDGLIENCMYYIKQIRAGIGTPTELLEAAETGSGYSGRAIPLEAFLAAQQRLADALLYLFVNQILKQLVRWNFGPGIKFEVKVKNLLQTKQQAKTGTSPAQQASAMGEDTAESPAKMPQANPQPMPPPGAPGSPGTPGVGSLPGVTQGAFSLNGPERMKVIADRLRRMAA